MDVRLGSTPSYGLDDGLLGLCQRSSIMPKTPSLIPPKAPSLIPPKAPSPLPRIYLSNGLALNCFLLFYRVVSSPRLA
jgi:hypothetical protein